MKLGYGGCGGGGCGGGGGVTPNFTLYAMVNADGRFQCTYTLISCDVPPLCYVCSALACRRCTVSIVYMSCSVR